MADFPSSGILTNNGTGTLSWGTIGAGGITADSLDWSEFKDIMTLDATTTIDMDTNSADFNFDAGTLYIDNAGYVGIGTTAPTATLTIAGDTYLDGSANRTIKMTDTPGFGSGTDLYITGSYAGAFMAFGSSGGDVFISGGAPRGFGSRGDVVLNPSGGAVGIGVSAPGLFTFEVNGDSYLGGNEIPISIGPLTGSGGYLGNGGIFTDGEFGLYDSSANVTLAVYDPDIGAVRYGNSGLMTILDTGYVGVGTTAPNALLTVGDGYFTIESNGTTTSNGNVMIYGPDSGSSLLINTDYTATGSDIFAHSEDYDFTDTNGGGDATGEKILTKVRANAQLYGTTTGIDNELILKKGTNNNHSGISYAVFNLLEAGSADSGGVNTNSTVALQNINRIYGPGTTHTEATGIYNLTSVSNALPSGSGVTTVSDMYGMKNLISNAAATYSTSIPNAYGIYSDYQGYFTNAVTTNLYQIYIANPYLYSGATIANNYGLYIEDQTSGTSLDYAIYSVGGTNYFGGNVGVGTTNPTSLFSIGATSPFQIDANGDIIKLKNLTYSWPTGHTTNGVLTNGGTGTLTWATIGATGITPDSLDWSEFTDTMTLDATTTINMDTNTADFNFDAGTLYIDNAGSVGIGTTVPRGAFEVAGETIFGRDTTEIPLTLHTTASNGVYFSNGSISSVGIGGFGGNGDEMIWYRDDTNGLFRYADDAIVADAADNVGIGTTDPDSQMHIVGGDTYIAPDTGYTFDNGTVNEDLYVYGNLEVDGNAYLATLYLGGTQVTSSAAELNMLDGATVTNGGIMFGNGTYMTQDATNFFWADSTDRLGIGTTAPASKLEILGTTEQLRLSYNAGNYSSFTIDSAGNLTFADTGTNIATLGAARAEFFVPTTFSAAGDVAIAYDLNMTNQTASQIESYGPLSIISGESFENNDFTLKTYGTGNAVFNLSGTGDMQLLASDPTILFDTKTATDTNFWMGVQEDAGGDDDDLFMVGDGTTAGTNAFLTIDTSGNTGIGTSTFTKKLTVYDTNSSTSVTAGLLIANDSTTTNSRAGIIFKNYVNNAAAIWSPSTGGYTGNLIFGTTNGGGDGSEGYITAKMTLDELGNLGIGTTDPGAYRLYLSGAEAYCDGTTCWNDASDLAFKENVETLDYGLAEVLALNPVRFDFKKTGDSSIGLIAQDVKEIIPEVVSGEDGSMGIAYGSLTPVLVKAIQDQQNIIDDILAKLDATTQASQTTQSTQSLPADILSEMKKIYDEFTEFSNALGLSTSDGGLLVNSDMSVTGNATFSDVTVTGTLSAGLMSLDPMEDSFDIIGPSCYNQATEKIDTALCDTQTLYLQKGLAGNVDIFNGKIVISPDGNIKVEGQVEATIIKAGEIIVDDASDAVGSSELQANSTSVTVNSKQVSANSVIMVTPTTPTGGQSLIVSEKTAGESFTIEVENEFGTDIKFDWLIVNRE